MWKHRWVEEVRYIKFLSRTKQFLSSFIQDFQEWNTLDASTTMRVVLGDKGQCRGTDPTDNVSEPLTQEVTQSVMGTIEHQDVHTTSKAGLKEPHIVQHTKPIEGSQAKHGSRRSYDGFVPHIANEEVIPPASDSGLRVLSMPGGKSATSPVGVRTRKQKLLAKLMCTSRTSKISPKVLRSSSTKRRRVVDKTGNSNTND